MDATVSHITSNPTVVSPATGLVCYQTTSQLHLIEKTWLYVQIWEDDRGTQFTFSLEIYCAFHVKHKMADFTIQYNEFPGRCCGKEITKNIVSTSRFHDWNLYFLQTHVRKMRISSPPPPGNESWRGFIIAFDKKKIMRHEYITFQWRHMSIVVSQINSSLLGLTARLCIIGPLWWESTSDWTGVLSRHHNQFQLTEKSKGTWFIFENVWVVNKCMIQCNINENILVRFTSPTNRSSFYIFDYADQVLMALLLCIEQTVSASSVTQSLPSLCDQPLLGYW